MSQAKRALMANQIATFFASQPGDRAAAVAAHINDFWGPDMRAGLLSDAHAPDNGLDALVVEALEHIRPPS
ncbi:MAG: formate dehydrogenase subunit delta [Maritimibacter sp.]